MNDIKSVTIRDRRGEILIKILKRKSGEYELIKVAGLKDVEVEIRDTRGRKVLFQKNS